MSSIRQQKVAALLQKEIASFFQRESKTYFAGAMISVTQVRVSPDLSSAKVYLSVFATRDKEEIFHFIETQTKEIRFIIGKQVGKQLRVVPELMFFFDDSLDYAENISNLLNE